MRHVVVALVLLSGVATVGLPAQAPRALSDNDFRISADKPPIYLTFERRGRGIDRLNSRMLETGEKTVSKQTGSDVWLRLHNNSRWAVSFATWSAYFSPVAPTYSLMSGDRVYVLGDGTEVNAKYQAVEQDGRIVAYGGDMEYVSWLPPGRSILFSVSSSHLSRGRSVYLYFNYEWERAHSYSYNLAPEHRVMYWSYRLKNDEKK